MVASKVQAFAQLNAQGAHGSHGEAHALRPALVLLGVGLFSLGFAYFALALNSGQFLVIAPFSFSKHDSLVWAAQLEDAQLVALGGLDNVVIVSSQATDFYDQAWAAGAWLVLPAPVGFGCSGPAQKRVK